MVQLRKSTERGFADHGWLKSRHTFSFADYRDPKHMGFRTLRVINEDRIQGGTGFGAHPHRDMEIISYVVNGSLQHADSMGTKSIIRPGEVQRMSAGSGITHSEQNNEPDQETHFFQIWIVPNKQGGSPSYGQKSFEAELKSGKLVLVLSQAARDGSIGIKQDADLYISRMRSNDSLEYKVRKGRGIWIQVIRGSVKLGNITLEVTLDTGDGVAIEDSSEIVMKANSDSEIMLFDLA